VLLYKTYIYLYDYIHTLSSLNNNGQWEGILGVKWINKRKENANVKYALQTL